MGMEASDLVNAFDNVTADDVRPYQYPHDKELEQVGVRGIYLNNYLRWDTKAQHEAMIRQYEYETAEQTRTFDTYNDVDCFNYSDVHDYIKYIKHGYGKATDHACREIRLRRMTREQGIEYVREYQSIPPRNLDLFCEWLGISENAFYFLTDLHRPKHLWHRDKDWNWQLLADMLTIAANEPNINAARLSLKEQWMDFALTPKKQSTDPKDQYILIGKGVA